MVKALSLLNSFRIDGLRGWANPTAGARLNLDGDLQSLALTAQDGKALGITISSQGFGIGNLSLPTSQNPSIALDPYLKHLRVDLHKELFGRLAEFARDPNLAYMQNVVNRVVLRGLQTVVRLTPSKVAHADVLLEALSLRHDDEELIRIRDVSLSLLDYDTTLPPATAQKECTVVLRDMKVEIGERFFDRLLEAIKPGLPKEVTDLVVELPGPTMVVGAHVKKSIFRSNVKADLELETESDLFGIHIKSLYVPGTNLTVPSFVRNGLLSTVSFALEKKLKGLAEVSNESIRINPWPKVPVKLLTHVSDFAVRDGWIHIQFTAPTDRRVPPTAEEHVLAKERGPREGDPQDILAPGPAL